MRAAMASHSRLLEMESRCINAMLKTFESSRRREDGLWIQTESRRMPRPGAATAGLHSQTAAKIFFREIYIGLGNSPQAGPGLAV